jgi:ppGpp synthetase/RelA/SpoT-type nucleotidyltranferase
MLQVTTKYLMHMTCVDDFLVRYRKEYDFYDQASRLAAQLLEQNLQTTGLRAMVTYRAKSPASLERKVRQRNKTKSYRVAEDIANDVVDLAGVRVALYFPGERVQVDKVVRSIFELDGTPKEFPAETVSPQSYQNRFSGYGATHYRVHIPDASLNEAQKRYSEARIEVQVASVLMHAWAEVNHDLVYKPAQGQLSEDEYAILDELNGLVIAGEIALERLQKAGEARVAAAGRTFSNHYDLAAYLLEKEAALLKGSNSDAQLGNVYLLYRLLDALGSAKPESIAPYLESLATDLEKRPLAEQVIDRLLAEHPDGYKIFRNIRSEEPATWYTKTPQVDDHHRELGKFLSEWVGFERLFREQSSVKNALYPTSKLLKDTGLFDSDALEQIEWIRRLRNKVVHGVEPVSRNELDRATKSLSDLTKELRARPGHRPGSKRAKHPKK